MFVHEIWMNLNSHWNLNEKNFPPPKILNIYATCMIRKTRELSKIRSLSIKHVYTINVSISHIVNPAIQTMCGVITGTPGLGLSTKAGIDTNRHEIQTNVTGVGQRNLSDGHLIVHLKNLICHFHKLTFQYRILKLAHGIKRFVLINETRVIIMCYFWFNFLQKNSWWTWIIITISDWIFLDKTTHNLAIINIHVVEFIFDQRRFSAKFEFVRRPAVDLADGLRFASHVSMTEESQDYKLRLARLERSVYRLNVESLYKKSSWQPVDKLLWLLCNVM